LVAFFAAALQPVMLAAITMEEGCREYTLTLGASLLGDIHLFKRLQALP